MIESVRGLVVLVAIAFGLAVAVVAAPVHTAATALDHAVLATFDPDRVNALKLVHPGRATVQLVRDPKTKRWSDPTSTAVFDPHAVDAMLASLRGARWHRRGDRARAGTITATLAIDGHTIELGASIAGADQAWVVVDGAAMLVDGWLVRTLDPELLALRDRAPLGDVQAAHAIDIGAVTLIGSPLRSPAGVIAAELTTRLVSALEHLVYVRLPDRAIDGAETVEVVLDHVARVRVGGSCPGAPNLVAVQFSGGDGCVEPAAWHEVLDATAAIDRPPEQILDRHPARPATELLRVAIAGTVIDLAKRPRLTVGGDPRDADPDRVAEWLAALAEPAEIVALPTATPIGQILVTPRSGDPVTIHLFSGGVLARDHEARGLKPSAAAWAVITRPVDGLVDPTRWIEDPSSVSSIAIDGKTFTRGAVIGEWTPTTATTDPTLVEALAIAAAAVRAPTYALPASFAPLHHVTVTLTPPVGTPSHHTIDLGAPSPEGCLARIDGIGVLAPLSLCTAAIAAAKH